VPPLPAPTGTVVTVSTEGELQNAVAALRSNTTIVLAPGTYALSSTVRVNGPLKNVGIRGATADPDDVVLVGLGMTNTEPGAVLHGISVGRGVQGIVIANLAIRDVFYHSIVLEAGTRAPHIYNVRLLNAGHQFIKAGAAGQGVNSGVIEYSTIEYTTSSALSSTSGIEIAAGSGWTVRGNLFRNIKAPSGQLAGPAVLVWRGSRESTVEGNTFINCQREIAFGLEQVKGGDHSAGIIRNNFMYRESSIAGDVAIQVADSADTEVLHNTILANGSATTLIESRFPAARGVIIRNNLLDGQVTSRDDAQATVEHNHTTATADLFVNAAAGDLHLVGSAAAAIDAAPVLSKAAADWDRQSRPQGAAADVGADEYTGSTDTTKRDASLSQDSLTASTSAAQTTSLAQTSAASLTAGSSTGLPSPWVATDIGNPARSGVTVYASGTFVVQAAGTDIWGTSDQFRFVYRTLEGDGEIVARVDSLDRTHAWAKAGVMIRDELTADAKHAFVMVTAGRGVAFQQRHEEGASAVQQDVNEGETPYWLKLTRRGTTFSAFMSSDGASWRPIGSASVSINRLAYVGLAVTSRNYGTLTNAIFSRVDVATSSDTPNLPPTVTISAPAAGTSYTAPATVTIAAAATDPDGSVTKVDFYAGSSLIGSDSGSPYGVTWKDAPEGTHALKAVAHDDQGASKTSAVVEITVGSNQPPAVTLTSPTQNASFTAPASIMMSASASDMDGTISKVEFFAGSTLVGSDTSSPYSVTWSDAPAGSYTLSAKAWDNSGASMISAGVNISIGSGNRPPTVSLTAPAEGATFAAGATITLTANASDPDGSIAWVEFYAGSTLIGSDPTSPYGATWNNATAGSHTLKAVARDNSASTTSSSPVAITVAAASSNAPRAVAFMASADHSTVSFYTVEIFQAGVNPDKSAPVRTQNVGKPTPVNAEIIVDVATTIQSLPAGSYFITVSATGVGGTSRSGPSETFTR
jgi:hypothetical protein